MSSKSREPISRPTAALGGLAPARLDPDASIPLYRQIYDALRHDILTGALEGGQRLVATRVMAEDLGVSRNTVLEAIEQLVAEGFLASRPGSGTFVTCNLPVDPKLDVAPLPLGDAWRRPEISTRGRRFRQWAPRQDADRSWPFQLGRPAVDRFPWKVWSRLLARRAREMPVDWLDYADSHGFRPLRESLARYLHSSRGLSCSPEQIIIVRGSQQGLDLAARVLLDEGDSVWIEDPGYPAVRIACRAAGAVEIPIPVDEEGIRVDLGRAQCPEARLAYVTPSHQFPLGVTLSLGRRLDLLRWARQSGAWILEDDYDSEYRFAGRPLASLAGLDGGRNVIYLGTLSKVLFPALRLGYLVVPGEHVDAFVGARYTTDRHTGTLEQAVVADFFDQGHFSRHVRRMRRLYADRQRALSEAVSELLSPVVELRSSETGLHDIGWLREGDDREIVRKAEQAGVNLTALSSYFHEAPIDARARESGLLFGYAGFDRSTLWAATERLSEVLKDG